MNDLVYAFAEELVYLGYVSSPSKVQAQQKKCIKAGKKLVKVGLLTEEQLHKIVYEL